MRIRIAVVFCFAAATFWPGTTPSCQAANVITFRNGGEWTGLSTLNSGALPELKNAVDAFRRGDAEASLKELQSAAAKHAHLPPPRLMLARMFLGSGQLPRGRAELERVAVESPDCADTHLTFAELAIREGRLSDAEAQLRRADALPRPAAWNAAQSDRFLAACRAGMAAVAERRNQWEVAHSELEAAVKLAADDAALHQRLGRAQFQLGNLVGCRASLDRAVSLDPSLAPAETLLGLFHAANGQPERAEQLLRASAQAHAENAKAGVALAALLLAQGRAEDAMPAVVATLRTDPKNRDGRMLGGLAQRFLEQPAAAESYFEGIVAETPEDGAAASQLAVVLAEQDSDARRQRGLELATAAVRRDPTNRELLAAYGWCLYQAGRRDEAERALQAALTGGTGPAAAAYYLAELYHASGRTDRARPLLEAAVKSTLPFPYRAAAARRLDSLPDPTAP